MKKLLLLTCGALLCGCTTAKKSGTAWYDVFESVKVDQMSGNNVSSWPLQRTILCLNARRESRLITAETNVVVSHVTNKTVSLVTNYLISSVTNMLANITTNQLLPSAPPLPVDTNDSANFVVSPPPPLGTATNTSVTRTGDNTLTVNAGKDQSVSTHNQQSSVTINHQLTTTLSNQAVTVTTNQTIRNDTSIIVTALTNQVVTSVTNILVRPVSKEVHEHFLYTELTPPPDFTLAQGESLILVLDGKRYGFSPTNSPSFSGRRELVSTLYRVPAETIVAIANAREAKVRLRGLNYSIERTLSKRCRENFRKFLLKYYVPEPALENLRAADATAGPFLHQSNLHSVTAHQKIKP